MEGPPHPLFFTVASFRTWRGSSCAVGGPMSRARRPARHSRRRWSCKPGPLVVFFEALTHADGRVFGEAERGVEGLHVGVFAADLQVELRAAYRPQAALGVAHQRGADAAAALADVDGQVIDPAAVPVVTGHHGADDAAIEIGDEEQLALHLELTRDVALRVVPGPNQAREGPQLDDARFVRLSEGSDHHLSHGVSVARELLGRWRRRTRCNHRRRAWDLAGRARARDSTARSGSGGRARRTAAYPRSRPRL